MNHRNKPAERGGLLDADGTDGVDADLTLGDDAEVGTSYGGGADGYASVSGSINANGAGADAEGGKLARVKAFLGGFSAKQWACAGVSLMVVLGLAFMFAHRPTHPSHAAAESSAPAPAALEMSAEVHGLGTDHMGHAAPEHQQHDVYAHSPEHDGAAQHSGEHEQPQMHAGAEHHDAGAAGEHHIHVEAEPDVEAPEGFEEIEGVDAQPLPGEDLRAAAHLEEEPRDADADAEHEPEHAGAGAGVGAGGEHVPRIVHSKPPPYTGGEYVAHHTVHDSVAVLSSGGDRPAHITHDGHEETHGPHLVEIEQPHDVDPTEWSHVFEDLHGVRWFHVLRDVHVWRVHGRWDNGKGADEIGFHFTSWKPLYYDQVRHGLGIHRQWQPMSELSLLTLHATPADLTPQTAHMEHEEVHDGTPTIIAIGPARGSVEPPSDAHHDTELDAHAQRDPHTGGIVLEGGEPIVVLYTPAHWTHEHKGHYAHRVLRVVTRHSLPRHAHSGL